MRSAGPLPLLLASLVAIACACSDVQDFRVASNAPPVAASAPVDPPPATAAPPACGTVDDPNNCGACGHSCLGGSCSAGACQPIVLAENQGIETYASYGPTAVIADDAHVFFLTQSAVARVPIAGGAVEKLGPGRYDSEMMLDQGFLYLLSTDRRSIARFPKDGGPLVSVTPPTTHETGVIQRFMVIAGTAAWTDHTKLSVCEALPCSEAQDPWGVTDAYPRSFGKSATQMYVTYAYPDGRGTGVECLFGAYKTALVTNTFDQVVVEEGPDQAYAYGASRGFIGRARLPISRPEGNQPYVPDKVLASGEELSPNDLALDGDYLYFVASAFVASAGIARVDKSGASLPELVLESWKVSTLSVGKDALYFGTTDGKVAKLAKPLPRTKLPPLP